ncbi:adenosine monophosphate-protein transferase [Sphingomonas sp. Root710]|uniref:Fic/DOC family protein n=1 Tax=Sphingomonas sp. Root710 TaxID=1736594 RepID=UPI0006F59721|nr:Fic family protein [Sphingomonas sp. Root710]KRB80629.1 adenosine monophosphate-protein transferase [Sphingomonas sp. Root710]
MYAVEDDPYCYPGTTVLRNRFDIRDEQVLEDLESELTTARADEPLPEGVLDETHFRAIHFHLFQDLYEWAGETRTVRLSKGTSHFCYPEHIDNQLATLFRGLNSDNHLRGLSCGEFATKVAAFLATLNVIHTFREGNGRAQLSFLLLLSENAGHLLDLAQMDPAAMLEAMIASFYGNEEPLTKILCDLIV